MINQYEFYRDREVQKRISEYCGGKDGNPATFTAEYIVGYGPELIKHSGEEYMSVPKTSFYEMLNKGLDIYRSNWDSSSTLGILDVEYFNLDFPGEIYLKQYETYKRLEPVYRAIMEHFGSFGIKPIVLMTGQGYHFSFRVSCDTDTDKMLEEAGFVNDSLQGKYRSTHGRRKRKVSIKHGRSFDGMGRVMEFFVAEFFKKYSKITPLPFVTTDVAIGKTKTGTRDAVSFDLSMYGDPIYMRDIRCPFSTYQKHKLKAYKIGEGISNGTPIMICIPRATAKNEISLEECMRLRTHYRNSASYAAGITTELPDMTGPAARLIEEYKKSNIYKIHQDFTNTEPHYWKEWPSTYDRLDTSLLPPCIAHCINVPNDNLLKPTNLQNLSRALIKKGWSPRHIAGLVRSKFERDYGWGAGWSKYDATTRANFYIRMFSTLLLSGVDREDDFNCVSQQEKGFCWKPWCGHNLASFRL